MHEALHLEKVTKRYGKVTAVSALDLTVQAGEVFGFLGPNGAGKTTTLRMVLDLLRPTEGSIRVFGVDPRQGPDIRRRIGYVSGEPALYGRLSGQQHLELASGSRGAFDPEEAKRLQGLLDARLDAPVEDLSHGNRQKVALIVALAFKPDLLLLDEPTQGLDPLAREAVHDLIRRAKAAGTTVFLSSHDLHEVEEVCDRVALIQEGRLVTVAAVKDLLAKQPRRVQVSLRQEPPANVLAGIPGVVDGRVQGRRVAARVHPPMASLLDALRPYGIHDVVSRPPSLEDVFLKHYRGSEHA